MYHHTVFSRLLEELPRSVVRKAVARRETDKHCKGFSSWSHLVTMVFAQVSGAKSLREIEAGFNHSPEQHYHLGAGKVCRSTLSEANQRRDPQLFADMCQFLMQRLGRKQRRELGELLYLMDASYLHLSGRGYDSWIKEHRNIHAQGLKLHVMLSADSATPVVARVTDPNINDIVEGKHMPIEAGATYVFDKAYTDFDWWHDIHRQEAFFVTRFKASARFLLEKDCTRASSQGHKEILADEQVRLATKRIGNGKPNPFHQQPLRRILVQCEGNKAPMCLATNDMVSPAHTIAGHYKARWGIELFFKWIKQHLKIKRFVGQSRNAVTIQIYTALIAYLLLQLSHMVTAGKVSLKDHLAGIRFRLFQRPETEYAMYKRRRKRQQELEKLQGQLAL